MNQDQLIARRVFTEVDHGLRVSGYAYFPDSRWREAILFYLFGIWGNNREVATYCPEIIFGGITLQLNRQDGEYYAYGHAEVPQDVSPFGLHDLYEQSSRQADVEVALIRFVKDNRIQQLRLSLQADRNGHHASLILWKKDKRSEYGYAGIGLPYTWGTRGPVWTREEYERSF